jgi:prepilin-type N-terminal cleavage/methylation domain-containing protein
MTRRGFTLVELLVAAVVMGILATALVRMLVSDSQFASQQDAMVGARRAARGALNVIAPELRMVTRDGLLAASRDSVRVRMPYAFGMTCRSTSSPAYTHASLLPYDSLSYANAQLGGVAWRDWRDTTGTYTFVSVTSVSSASPSQCPSDSIRVVPGGRAIRISPVLTAPVGSVFYLYQNITYRFAASTALPGRIGLWRRAGTATAQELLSPFDTSAGFRCLVGSALTPVTCPPVGGVSTVRGIELRLVGASEKAAEGKAVPERFDLITKIPFLNGLPQ